MEDKIVFLFNRTTIDLLKEVKDKSEYLKKKIKKNYRVYDKTNKKYIVNFWKTFEEYCDIMNEPTSDLDQVRELDILDGIKVSHILDLKEPRYQIHIYTLYLYAMFYQYYKDQVDNLDVLLEKTVRVIFNMDDDNIETYLEEILDDDVLSILRKMYTLNKTDQPANQFSHLLGNSKIVNIAKEICDEITQDKSIDLSSIQNSGGSISDLQELLSSNNNIIGDLIGKVGSSINAKMESGEINQEDLMNDALAMLSKFGGSQELSGLMSMISGSVSGGTDMPALPEK
jgi:thiol-disulfide isomerase/thioredoxin